MGAVRLTHIGSVIVGGREGSSVDLLSHHWGDLLADKKATGTVRATGE